MDKYLAIFKIGIKDGFQYRGQLIYWVFFDGLFLVMVYFLWRAIFAQQDLVGGYTFSALITYYIIAFMVEIIIAHYSEYNMEDIVRNGKLNKYLIRPMSFFWYRFANEHGWRFAKLVVAFPLYFVVFIFLRKYLVVADPITMVRFFVSLAFSSVLYFLVSFLISYFAFWFLKISSIVGILRNSLIPLLAGAFIPLEFFPEAARRAVELLPFQYLVYFPIKVYLGELAGGEFWAGIAITALWVVILGILTRALWPAALRKYESVGG